MARKPLLLDLFCGAGGAAMGYHQAGFDVVGVDIAPQPNFSFEFHQGDALEYLQTHGSKFDLIHASPPCQAYSITRYLPNQRDDRPDMIDETRQALVEIGKPYVIENVVGAPLNGTIVLCGTMFGLRVYRHRVFETSFLMFQPAHRKHTERVKPPTKKGCEVGYYINKVGAMVTVAGGLFGLAAGSHAMQIDWMTKKELAQSIPPAYTKYIGRQWLRQNPPCVSNIGCTKTSLSAGANAAQKPQSNRASDGTGNNPAGL